MYSYSVNPNINLLYMLTKPLKEQITASNLKSVVTSNIFVERCFLPE